MHLYLLTHISFLLNGLEHPLAGRRLLIIHQHLLSHLVAGMSQMQLVEWLRLVEPVAVLRAHHVGVQVLLGLPGRAVEEVHGRREARGGHCALALGGQLHGVVEVDLVHVGDLLAEVVSLLEARVREGLSCGCGHLSVPNAGVADGKGGLSVPVVDGVHGGILLGYL